MIGNNAVSTYLPDPQYEEDSIVPILLCCMTTRWMHGKTSCRQISISSQQRCSPDAQMLRDTSSYNNFPKLPPVPLCVFSIYYESIITMVITISHGAVRSRSLILSDDKWPLRSVVHHAVSPMAPLRIEVTNNSQNPWFITGLSTSMVRMMLPDSRMDDFNDCMLMISAHTFRKSIYM